MAERPAMRILLVEDNPGDVRLIREMCRATAECTYQLVHHGLMADAACHLAANPVDIIMLDLGLPDAGGIEAVRMARAAAPATPLVVLTGWDDDALAAQALHEGAQDYLIKGQLDMRGMRRAIRYAVERKRLQEALHLGAERLRLATDSGGIGIWELDFLSNRIVWDRRMHLLHDLDPADGAITGNAWRARMHPEDRAAANRTFAEAVAGSHRLDMLFRVVWRDGSLHHIRNVGEVIRDAAGAPLRMLGVNWDVTREVTEAAVLANTRETLFQMQKMEAIGRLSAGIAHDVNNILQSIVGGLELVLDEVAPGTPAQKFTEVAINAAMRGAGLTHGLLSYTHKQVLLPRSIPLAPFLEDMKSLLSRTLGPHIRICVRADPASCVLADPSQLQTALLNLAINASHAMKQGGLLTLESREETAAGRLWVALRVTDTGSGMDAATLRQAAEPFFTTKGQDGTGLGLSMVQGFAEQSGGRFNIGSVPGHGTTIELRLPASAINAGIPAEAAD